MKDKHKYRTGQLFNFAGDSYLERTSRPIYAVVFLLPFIVFYELGTIFINTNLLQHYWQGRVVAFSWLQGFLVQLGFGSKFAWVVTPLAVVVILIALQMASRKQWRFWFGDIWRMAIECIFLAVPLIVLTLFLSSSTQPQSTVLGTPPVALGALRGVLWTNGGCRAASLTGLPAGILWITGQNESMLANIVTGIGAGIYEELVFRLILMCLLMMLFQDLLRLNRKKSIMLSVLISAALFSAHHHIDFLSGQPNPADPFDITRFIFRTIAGVYFAVLFAIRGFGITAGTHTFYNIIAISINARFFQQ